VKKSTSFLSIASGIYFICGCTIFHPGGISQHYHRITSKYNLLFNGNQSLEIGVQKLKQTYVPDFYDTIFQVDPKFVPSKLKYFPFAEKRALSVIEQHQTQSKPLWRQPQIIDAHLLWLKSCFYQGKDLPNLKLISKLERKNLKPSRGFEVLYWVIKAHIHSGEPQEAIELIQENTENKILDKNQKIQLQKLLAQAHINLKKNKLALKPLEFVLNNPGKFHLRNQFIYAQLLYSLDSNRLAISQFQKLANLDKKNLYSFYSKLYLIKLKHALNNTSPLEDFHKLLKPKYYAKYHHYIYHQLGKYYYDTKNTPKAIYHLLASNNTPQIDRFTELKNNQLLYKLEIESLQFVKALGHLDAIIKIREGSDSLMIERQNLEKLILTDQQLIQISDSIELALMSQENLKLHFDHKIDNLISSSTTQQNTIGFNREIPSIGVDSTNFFGGIEVFNKQWGKRPNVDNWRYSWNMIGEFNHHMDLTSNQIKKQDIHILWNYFLDTIEQLRENMDVLSLRYHQKLLELGNYYLLFGLVKQAKELLDNSREFNHGKELEKPYLDLQKNIGEIRSPY